jgi:HlyD family secretion protein
MSQEISENINQMPRKKLLNRWFTKKKIIWTVIILLVVGFIGYKIVKGKNPAAGIQTDTVKKQNLQTTVLSTGQVVSGTDLHLSFKASGIVVRVSVKEGDKVKNGDVLATLDQKDQLASLTSARGSLAQAEANYQRVISGASNEDVAVTQVTLDNAKSSLQTTKEQQQVLVDNAFKTLLTGGLAAIPSSGNTSGVTATVTGSYTGTQQGSYKVSMYATGGGLHYQVSGLESGDGLVDVTPQPVGTHGLYIQFSSASVPTNNSWVISIPNAQSSVYTANYNAYQSALQTQQAAVSSAQNAVVSAQAALDLKKSQARPADVAAAQAQILSAQGQVQAAQASLENTIVRAPSGGTITQVDVKVGEQSSGLKEVMILQDVGNLHAEANVSEADIASLQQGQPVDYTFDALGSDRHFAGVVQTINPASTVVSGVVNYKITASLENIPDIKPGMTANMTVLVAKKDNVLAIPQQAIVNQNNKHYVRVIDDTKKKTYHQVEVKTGLQADGGLVEALSGVSEGQEIVTYIKP